MKIFKVFAEGNDNPVGSMTVVIGGGLTLTFNSNKYWDEYSDYYVHSLTDGTHIVSYLLSKMKYLENVETVKDLKG